MRSARQVFELLERARAETRLPKESPNADALERWLMAARLRWLEERTSTAE